MRQSVSLSVVAVFSDIEAAKKTASDLYAAELVDDTLFSLKWPVASEKQILRMRSIFDALMSEGKLEAPADITTNIYERQENSQKQVVRKSEVPLGRKAKNFGGAVKRMTMAAMKNKMVLASEDEASKRLSICEQCVHYDGGRCADITLADGTLERGCGCNLKAKTRLQTESCAYGKW